VEQDFFSPAFLPAHLCRYVAYDAEGHFPEHRRRFLFLQRFALVEDGGLFLVAA
jgi:hypothetical protein